MILNVKGKAAKLLRMSSLALGFCASWFGVPVVAQDKEPCDCNDIPMIRYRIEEAEHARDFFSAKALSINAEDAFSASEWANWRSELKQELVTMTHSSPATADNASTSTTDSGMRHCTTAIETHSACMRSILGAHEGIHFNGCSEDPSIWMTSQELMVTMLKEEVSAYQAEIDYMTKVLKELSCKCQRFGLLIRHDTSATLIGRGARVDLNRFLNGVDESGGGLFGVKIPVFVSEQGQVEGDGSGHETGWGTLLARGATGKADMDAPITIEAQGTISPGQGCTATGCSSDDMLHVTLRGEQGQNSGMSHVQVGGRIFNGGVSPGGGNGQISFDLPAYVGEHAEQTITVGTTGVESKVSVEIVSLKRFEPGAVDGPGTSLLWTAKGCKESQ